MLKYEIDTLRKNLIGLIYGELTNIFEVVIHTITVVIHISPLSARTEYPGRNSPHRVQTLRSVPLRSGLFSIRIYMGVEPLRIVA